MTDWQALVSERLYLPFNEPNSSIRPSILTLSTIQTICDTNYLLFFYNKCRMKDNYFRREWGKIIGITFLKA